jgi:hypothetical protein
MKTRKGFRRVAVAAIVPLLFLVALVSWGFSSPVGSSPDDDYHLTSIWCAGGLDELCQAGDQASERTVPDVLLTSSGCYAFHPEASADCVAAPVSVMSNTNRGNFVGSYPPVFYSAMNVFAGADVATSVLLMRGFNALLYVGVLSALFFALPRQRRGPLLWGSLITLVPLGMFIIPSVNPSSWAILSAATLWISLVAYFTATSVRARVGFGAFAGLATVMGAGARSDSAVYAGVAVVMALVLTFRPTKNYLKLAILPAAVLAIAIAFFFASGQSGIVDPGSSTGDTSLSAKINLAIANLVLLPGLWTGALGTTGLGWLDTAMPAAVWVSTVAVFFSVVFWGLQRITTRRGIALTLMAVCLVVIPLYVLVKDGMIVGAGVQPRYIYPLMIMFAGVALLAFNRLDLSLSRVQLGLVSILLAVANSFALHTNMRRYITGNDVIGADLDARIEWWWSISVSPMAIWGIGSLSFAIAMVGVYLYSRRSARQPDELDKRLVS